MAQCSTILLRCVGRSPASVRSRSTFKHLNFSCDMLSPKTGSRKPKTGSRKEKKNKSRRACKAENRKPKAENRKPKAEDRKPKAENRKPKGKKKTRVEERAKPKTESRKPKTEAESRKRHESESEGDSPDRDSVVQSLNHSNLTSAHADCILFRPLRFGWSTQVCARRPQSRGRFLRPVSCGSLS